jgi:hypothetical protein
MREHGVLVGEFDAEHRSGEHGGDFAFCFDDFFHWHK